MIRAELKFLGNNSIWYSFYGKFATFRDFEKNQVFFSKNLSIFWEKTQILNVSRNLTILVAFYGKLAIIWSKKLHVQKREQACRCGMNTIGKHRV